MYDTKHTSDLDRLAGTLLTMTECDTPGYPDERMAAMGHGLYEAMTGAPVFHTGREDFYPFLAGAAFALGLAAESLRVPEDTYYGVPPHQVLAIAIATVEETLGAMLRTAALDPSDAR